MFIQVNIYARLDLTFICFFISLLPHSVQTANLAKFRNKSPSIVRQGSHLLLCQTHFQLQTNNLPLLQLKIPCQVCMSTNVLQLP